jgi:drug/metabolite transporter (DMT)-like permease
MSARGHWKADLTLAGISFIWGATFVVVKDALPDVSVLLFLALRFSLALAMVVAMFRGRLSGDLTRADWMGGGFCGVCLFAGYALQTAGLRFTSASKSAFLTGLYIVLVPLLSSLVFRNAPRVAEWLGAMAAMAGTALLSSTESGLELGVGEWMTVGCAFAFSAHITAVAHFSKKIDYEWLTVMQIAGVAALSAGSFWWAETPRIAWTGKVWFALVTTAALATALSFSLYTWAQRHTTATRAALIFALEPVFAGLVGWWWAGEEWTKRMLVGAGLILLGILLVEVKPKRGGPHPQAQGECG